MKRFPDSETAGKTSLCWNCTEHRRNPDLNPFSRAEPGPGCCRKTRSAAAGVLGNLTDITCSLNVSSPTSTNTNTTSGSIIHENSLFPNWMLGVSNAATVGGAGSAFFVSSNLNAHKLGKCQDTQELWWVSESKWIHYKGRYKRQVIGTDPQSVIRKKRIFSTSESAGITLTALIVEELRYSKESQHWSSGAKG